jgi:hypothetical protein
MSIETMKQALEALELHGQQYPHMVKGYCVDAITALRAAIEQAERKEWQGLTDEEIKTAWSQLWYDLNNGKFAASDDPSRHTTVMFARAIEAKLKEKNNAA